MIFRNPGTTLIAVLLFSGVNKIGNNNTNNSNKPNTDFGSTVFLISFFEFIALFIYYLYIINGETSTAYCIAFIIASFFETFSSVGAETMEFVYPKQKVFDEKKAILFFRFEDRINIGITIFHILTTSIPIWLILWNILNDFQWGTGEDYLLDLTTESGYNYKTPLILMIIFEVIHCIRLYNKIKKSSSHEDILNYRLSEFEKMRSSKEQA